MFLIGSKMDESIYPYSKVFFIAFSWLIVFKRISLAKTISILHMDKELLLAHNYIGKTSDF